MRPKALETWGPQDEQLAEKPDRSHARGRGFETRRAHPQLDPLAAGGAQQLNQTGVARRP